MGSQNSLDYDNHSLMHTSIYFDTILKQKENNMKKMFIKINDISDV